MALRRRDQIPPYEIMRSRGNTGAPGVGAGEPVEAESPSPPARAVTPANAGPSKPAEPTSTANPSGSAAPWWVGSSAPIVLRVPRGLAALIVIGILGLFVLSYWVGSARGKSAAQQQDAQRASVVNDPIARRTPPISISNDTAGVGSDEEGSGGPAVQVFDERREDGLYYLRLLTGNLQECLRLAEFLADKQVAIQLVKRDNGECFVYAVDRGFQENEREAEVGRAYKRQLQELGRSWRRYNNNRGTDLSTMFYAKYMKS